jgi:hypothetical protein
MTIKPEGCQTSRARTDPGTFEHTAGILTVPPCRWTTAKEWQLQETCQQRT